MSLSEELRSGKKKLAVVGLGYVGLPLAVAFANHFSVIGFDVNGKKIESYKNGFDPTAEIGDEAVKKSSVEFTNDESKLREASFFVIAVPTPINGDKTPDLKPVRSASEVVGRNMKSGSIVVFESTVYPGVTEDICAPILEKESGLKCGTDFFIGYSPERINPGDKVHRLENIVKIVSGMDEKTMEEIAGIYETIISVGVYRAPNIRVAEAAKLVENAQRDINIAFMNELAKVFDRMGIATNEVVKAMDTKWNALRFKPGLVGGHCIGIDPYYFIYQAELLGYNSEVISAGRRVNDGMGEYVARAIVRNLVLAKADVSRAKIYLFGMTFKENCPDTRNSRPADVYYWLQRYGLDPVPVDPVADIRELKSEYDIVPTPLEEVKDADCIAVLVAHRDFKNLKMADFEKMFKAPEPDRRHVLIDVKSIYKADDFKKAGYAYWSL